jgi:hypothetical protein
MSNPIYPLTVQGEEIYVGWEFWDGHVQFIVTFITQGGSVAFETIDGRPQTAMPFSWFKKWLEPPAKNPS